MRWGKAFHGFAGGLSVVLTAKKGGWNDTGWNGMGRYGMDGMGGIDGMGCDGMRGHGMVWDWMGRDEGDSSVYEIEP